MLTLDWNGPPMSGRLSSSIKYDPSRGTHQTMRERKTHLDSQIKPVNQCGEMPQPGHLHTHGTLYFMVLRNILQVITVSISNKFAVINTLCSVYSSSSSSKFWHPWIFYCLHSQTFPCITDRWNHVVNHLSSASFI